MYDYLNHIGEINFAKLGYNFHDNMRILNENIPLPLSDLLATTIPLRTLLEANINQEKIQQQNVLIKNNQEIIHKLNSMLKAKKNVINKINSELASNRKIIETKNQELEAIYSSKKWKLVTILAGIKKP